MQDEEQNHQRILSETVDQTNIEINKIDDQSNKDEILIESITRGIERQNEESLDSIKSITFSNVINLTFYFYYFKYFVQFYINFIHALIRNRNSKSV